MPKKIDLTGKKFYKLTVLKEVDRGKKRDRQWECVCDCGNICIVQGNNLKSGHTKSCGCHNREMASKRLSTHGQSKTKLHKIWYGMKNRCFNPNNHIYDKYGGRGITVCEEWKEFEPFRDWALANGYAEGLTIDRIDVNGNYEPSNCRWATMKEQQNNRRNNRYLTYNGETHTMAEWAEIKGLSEQTLAKRLNKHGWSVERALTTPTQKRYKNNDLGEKV
jgi:hypothetical protein